MHSTYSQTTHFGTQPIRVLQHNITDQLEKIDSCFLEKLTRLVESKGLDPGIKYSAEEEPIRDDEGSHVANISADGEMELHETYLSYLWCLSFATLTLFEEVNLKPRLKATSNKPSLRHVKNAENLFYYAMSLRTKFSPWDKELPNPKTFCEEDRTYIEKANGLFLWAVVWVLCHEIAHFKKKGQCQWNLNGFGPKDPGQRRDGAKPSGFDLAYPINEDWKLDGLKNEYSAGELLATMKGQLPFLLRYDLKHPALSTTHVDISGIPHTAKSLAVQVAKSLGSDWQLLLFKSHMTLYPNKRNFQFSEQLFP